MFKCYVPSGPILDNFYVNLNEQQQQQQQQQQQPIKFLQLHARYLN